jgi:hypothetical protein
MALVSEGADRANVLAAGEEREVTAEMLEAEAEALESGAEGAKVVPVTTASAKLSIIEEDVNE